MRKIIAIVCSITLIASSISIYGATASDGDKDGDITQNPWSELFTTESVTTEPGATTVVAPTEASTTVAQTTAPTASEAAKADWASAAFLGGTAEPQYKVIVVKGVQEVVNVQNPPFATAEGIYMTFADADFGDATVDGSTLSKDIEGAGMIVHLSNFTNMYSTVTINKNDGTEKAVFYVYNAKGANGDVTTEAATTVAATTVAATTVAATTVVAPTEASTTVAPTEASTTVAATTVAPTEEPTTVAATTVAPTEEPTTAEVTTSGSDKADWASASFLAGTAESQYKVIVVSGVQEVVNVQKPGFATAEGIYMTFADADFGDATVDGNTLSKDIEGAGMIVHLSNFTNMYSTVTIKKADGTEKAVFYVYNAKGANGDATTAASTTVSPTTAEVTTTVAATTVTPTTVVVEKPSKPEGLAHISSGDTSSTYYFTWSTTEAVSYNFYVNGNLVANTVAANYSAAAALFATAGDYTVGVTAVNASGTESDMATITFKSSEIATTVAPTEAATTAAPTTTEVTTSGADKADWASASFLGGTTEPQYKVIVVSGVQEVVNVQKPGFATAEGIYMTFADADFGDATVDGNALSKDIEGAGMIVHLSNFTDMYNTVAIKKADGTEKAVFYVYNAKGANGDATTVAPTEASTTVVATTAGATEAPTTVAATTVATEEPTTVASTTAATEEPTTVVATTIASTTVAATEEPTTVAATTIASTTVAATEQPTTSGADKADWASASFLAGTAESQYKVIVVSGVQEVVSVQKPGFATAEGIYMTFADADFGDATVDGSTLSKDIEGAGMIVHLSNFTNMYSTVTINKNDGTEKAVFYVYNAKGANGDVTTAAPTTVATTTATVEKPSKPEGLAHISSGDTSSTYYFTWSTTEAVSYNFYVNGNLVANTVAANYSAAASLFATAGDYTVGVTAVNASGTESDMATITFTVSGVTPTTVAGETTAAPTTVAGETTAAPTEAPTAVAPTTAEVTTSGAEKADWASASFLAGTAEQQYKVIVVSGVQEVVNVQKPGFATAEGIYMTFDDADLGDITVNGKELSKDVAGAGIIAHLSNFTDMYSTVTVKKADGTEKAVFYVYNAKGANGDVTTAAGETTAVATTAAGETTATPATTTTSSSLTLESCIADSAWHANGGYSYYVGTWNDSTAQMGVDPSDADHVQIQQLTSNWGQAWGLQLKKTVSGLQSGSEYTVSIDMYSPSADGKYMITGDAEGTKRNLTVGTTTLSAKIAANDQGDVEFGVGLGWVGTSVVLDFSNVKVTDSAGNVVYPSGEPTETTTATTETTTATTETTTATTETTTPVVTTPSATTPAATTPTVTTKKQDATTVAKPARAKIAKVSAKKKASNKAKISLKKTKGANGYQIQISKAKKFKKGKILVTKVVKKVKVTIKSKKIKNKSKLYVRARAYKLVNGTKVYGDWSKTKKIKIKK